MEEYKVLTINGLDNCVNVCTIKAKDEDRANEWLEETRGSNFDIDILFNKEKWTNLLEAIGKSEVDEEVIDVEEDLKE